MNPLKIQELFRKQAVMKRRLAFLIEQRKVREYFETQVDDWLKAVDVPKENMQ